jgi:DNA-binding XRE family transcriptional regulator
MNHSSEGTQGAELKRARKKKHLTQAEVAEAIGVDTKTVKRWEDNRGTPRGYSWRKLCLFFHETSEELKLGILHATISDTAITSTQRSIEEPTTDIGRLDTDETIADDKTKYIEVKPYKANSFLKNVKNAFLPLSWLSTRPNPKLLWLISIVLIAFLIFSLIPLSFLLVFSHKSISSPHRGVSTHVATIPPPKMWTTLLQEPIPGCHNPDGTVWRTPLPGTAFFCGNNGLLMQQTLPNYYAELDLDDVKGNTYNQSIFRVSVNITFQNPTDTATWASLLVQTPQAEGVAGGYILALNSTGQWQLQDTKSATNIPIVRQGSLSIHSSEPTMITIVVINKTFYAAINNHWVIDYPDTLNKSPAAVSFLVERPGDAHSSPILFSKFYIDQ